MHSILFISICSRSLFSLNSFVRLCARISDGDVGAGWLAGWLLVAGRWDIAQHRNVLLAGAVETSTIHVMQITVVFVVAETKRDKFHRIQLPLDVAKYLTKQNACII